MKDLAKPISHFEAQKSVLEYISKALGINPCDPHIRGLTLCETRTRLIEFGVISSDSNQLVSWNDALRLILNNTVASARQEPNRIQEAAFA